MKRKEFRQIESDNSKNTPRTEFQKCPYVIMFFVVVAELAYRAIYFP